MPQRTKDHNARDAAITGAGATSTGVGFVAGGVPGAKANVRPLSDAMKGEPRSGSGRHVKVTPVRRAANAARAAPQAGRGGILGFRVYNHEGGTYAFKQKATMGEWYPSDKAKEAFAQGRHRGKVAPEETIIRQMKNGKKAAGLAMAAGGAAMAYGQRDRIKSAFDDKILHKRQPSQQTQERRSGAAIGVGGTGLVVSGGVGGLLGHQERRWNRAEAQSKEAEAKLIPGLRGMSDKDIIRNPHVFDGVDAKTGRAAGIHRGAAAQARHFAHVYRNTGRVVRGAAIPSALVAGAGVVGLERSRKKKNGNVNKSFSVSAFGVVHA